MNISEELHFNNLLSFPFAGIASSAIHIKRKMFGLKATHFAQRLFGKKVSYLIIGFYISDRIAPGRFSDRVLINQFDLRYAFNIAGYCFMKTHLVPKLTLYLLQTGI